VKHRYSRLAVAVFVKHRYRRLAVAVFVKHRYSRLVHNLRAHRGLLLQSEWFVLKAVCQLSSVCQCTL